VKPSRRETARTLGTSAPRLRQAETAGTLPAFGAVPHARYEALARLWLAARSKLRPQEARDAMRTLTATEGALARTEPDEVTVKYVPGTQVLEFSLGGAYVYEWDIEPYAGRDVACQLAELFLQLSTKSWATKVLMGKAALEFLRSRGRI
jgi:hypothetical protein